MAVKDMFSSPDEYKIYQKTGKDKYYLALQSTRKDLDALKTELASTNKELDQSRYDTIGLSDELDDIKNELASSQKEVAQSVKSIDQTKDVVEQQKALLLKLKEEHKADAEASEELLANASLQLEELTIAYKELEANFNKPRVIPFLGKNRLSYQSDILERWYGDKRHVEEVKIARKQLINAWYEYLPKFQSWIKIQITRVDRLLAKTS